MTKQFRKGRTSFMATRFSTQEGMERFKAFCEESKRPKALEDINFSSPVIVQVITYHLYNEYIIENWVNHKIGNGTSVFKDASFSTNSKLTFAKNIGLPMEIYKAAKLLNRIRNIFAHNINENPINDKTIQELITASDNINLKENIYSSLYSNQKDRIDKLNGDEKTKHILFIILSTMSLKIWNYVFMDMYLSNTYS